MGMAERIKERRISKGFTQEELGKKIGLQKSAIAKYENGRVKNIKRSVIENMAEVLECSPCYLMGWGSDLKNSIRDHADRKQMGRLLDYYRQLNKTGKDEAIKRIGELSGLPQYVDGADLENQPG